MTEHVAMLLERLQKQEYRKKRNACEHAPFHKQYGYEQIVSQFREMVTLAQPTQYAQDDFGFYFGCSVPLGASAGNVTPNYGRILTEGLNKTICQIRAAMGKTREEEKRTYGQCMLDMLEICLQVCEQQKALALKMGNEKLYQALCHVPRQGARTLYEALVCMKMSIFFLRLANHDHLGFGRFDQYLYPFYLQEKAQGTEDEEILALIESFFIAINMDTDLYNGVQQGDNGQSMVLGGFDEDGNSMYNALSHLCMRASLELKIIDPKINLRVGKNTPDEVYEFATLLTRQGLGFPQYCNDDVVVPGLIKLGYDKQDALNYGVAACWEYIIPHCGSDWPNLETMDFPLVVGGSIRRYLMECDTFEQLTVHVRQDIAAECERLIENCRDRVFPACPLLSVYMDGCIQTLTDMWEHGAKYTNFGCHGAGIANAADALYAVKENVYDEARVTKAQLLDALDKDFEGFDALRNLLRESPKMGQNDDRVDSIACMLMDVFSSNMNGRFNDHQGVWRAGTGSAMEYLWRGEKCPATADGRKKGEPYSSSFSPSLDVKSTGLLSVLQSFTKFDMTRIINGGPLTIEVHDTVLRNDMGIQKTAQLVKMFILLGGHQLQINAISRERLLDAQKHPEKYPQLIVRVWGWSGYFNELDVKYQNHIIRRTEYTV